MSLAVRLDLMQTGLHVRNVQQGQPHVLLQIKFLTALLVQQATSSTVQAKDRSTTSLSKSKLASKTVLKGSSSTALSALFAPQTVFLAQLQVHSALLAKILS